MLCVTVIIKKSDGNRDYSYNANYYVLESLT